MGVAEKCNYIRIDLDTAENEPRQVAENVSNPRFEQRAGRFDILVMTCDSEETQPENFIVIFIDFLSEASADRGRIVCANPASSVFMIFPEVRSK